MNCREGEKAYWHATIEREEARGQYNLPVDGMQWVNVVAEAHLNGIPTIPKIAGPWDLQRNTTLSTL